MRATEERAARLAELLNGTLVVHGSGRGSSIEYRLAQQQHRLSASTHYIGALAARRCLQHKLVAFVGDSRMRFLYAALISLLANHNASAPELNAQPRHKRCPFDNTAGRHSKACAAFYSPHGQRLFRSQFGSTHVLYSETHHGVEHETAVAARAHIVFANVGAWRYYRETEAHGRPSFGSTSAAASSSNAIVASGTASVHARFYDALRTWADPSATRIAIGYPWCSAGAAHLHSSALPHALQRHLAASGWLQYVPMRLTSFQTWNGRHFGRAWCDPLLPQERATRDVKWDQCEGAHTYDTLADLEVQILLSVLCS